jgi:hypothetical protein
MKAIKPLVETNPYLRDPIERQKRIARSVRSSSGVEGIRPKKDSVQLIEIKNRVPNRINGDC